MIIIWNKERNVVSYEVNKIPKVYIMIKDMFWAMELIQNLMVINIIVQKLYYINNEPYNINKFIFKYFFPVSKSKSNFTANLVVNKFWKVVSNQVISWKSICLLFT